MRSKKRFGLWTGTLFPVAGLWERMGNWWAMPEELMESNILWKWRKDNGHQDNTKHTYSGMKSICCGDNFYSHLPNEKVIELQKKRAEQMLCMHVVVYCIGDVHSMTAGGKIPLYLPDLVFGHETKLMTNTLDEYHNDLSEYIALH